MSAQSVVARATTIEEANTWGLVSYAVSSEHVRGNPERGAIQNVCCDLFSDRPSMKLWSVSKVFVSAWTIGDYGVACE